jgi:hypothetical protein
MKGICAGLGMVVVLTLQPFGESNLESIATRLFVGQIYPSGNVYLKPLAGEQQPGGNLPKSVFLLPLSSDPAVLKTPPTEATLASATVKFDYIPRLEGMDADHLTCGPSEPRKRSATFRYLSEDFFDAVFDYCDDNDDVSLYRSSLLSYSVKVLAFSSDANIVDTRLVSGPRPATPAEEQEISRQKRELQKEGECSTTPAFADSAVRLVEAMTGSGINLRVSAYKTPGCAGHLTTIYILDVLRGQDLIRTFQISQNHGPL